MTAVGNMDKKPVQRFFPRLPVLFEAMKYNHFSEIKVPSFFSS